MDDLTREARLASVLEPPVPEGPGAPLRWGRLYGAALPLALARAAARHGRLLVVIAPDAGTAERLGRAVRALAPPGLPVLDFPDWETLPYDPVPPHPDSVSRRLETLSRLPRVRAGVLVVPAATLLQRLAPPEYVEARTLSLEVGERLDVAAFRARLEAAGYRAVPEVGEHGEYAVRGAVLDLFPAGAPRPYRLDLFDDEIESIRTFDPETQRSVERVEAVRLLPAREFPLDEEAIAAFRRRYRERFEGDPRQSVIYRDVSRGLAPGGVEYYLPLFFERTVTLFDYLPEGAVFVELEGAAEAAERFWAELGERYETRRRDPERPALEPEALYLPPEEAARRRAAHPRIEARRAERHAPGAADFATAAPPELRVRARAREPAAALRRFLETFRGRVLFAAETPGRREVLRGLLADHGIRPRPVEGWQAFLEGDAPLALGVVPVDEGLVLEEPALAVVTEAQLLGERARPRRRRAARDPEAVVRDLTDLRPGAPVVHVDHGVGRYRGLERLTLDGVEQEFLVIEYAGGDRIYVPVASLHLVSRYTGAADEAAPLHRLGGEQWRRARRRAAKRARDVAAELLEIHARRAARPGRSFRVDPATYAAFAEAFPFEETPDQQAAIEAVLADLAAPRPMDRVVCGDVGFGKTEVALRAAFVVAMSGAQVAVLVPTTLLAQQHHQNFLDRFADWPVRVAALSRLRSRKEQEAVLADLAAGRVDVVVGTHRLLQKGVRFKDLGLVIVDEEHRFGVRHKERLKALRAEVDVLTLTATPIPRTLNMALAGLRDLSIIATPPPGRMAVKTLLCAWEPGLIREACLREIRRGGQVYYVHNEVESIERAARRVRELVPEASVRVAHGQMRERELEQVMLDFYHQRFNVLVCTTIIESGIDVPSANTMIIERADRFGLAQLHQLRGRVGRSHHRAYCYLVLPPRELMTADAVKRIEAIESLDELGAGFTLATHDLEIRGAGELLGEAQSGHIQEVGFGLYMEMLERAVAALKAGRLPPEDLSAEGGVEVDLGLAALIPEDYLPDVDARLVLYKRIAGAADRAALRELEAELVDRFGPLPRPLRHLLELTALRRRAEALGIQRVEAGPRGGRLVFGEAPRIDPARLVALVQGEPGRYRLDGQRELRFEAALEGEEARIAAVAALLEAIAPAPAGAAQPEEAGA